MALATVLKKFTEPIWYILRDRESGHLSAERMYEYEST